MTSPKMPAEVREAVIEILAAALVADVERHPELYAGDPAPDQPVATATGKTPRGLARTRLAPVSRVRRGRRPAGIQGASRAAQRPS